MREVKFKKKARRHRERLLWINGDYIIMYYINLPRLQKLYEQQSVFEKQSYQVCDREKWDKVFVNEMMSSEENGRGPTGNSMIVNPQPWHSTRVNNFQSLDDQSKVKNLINR